MGFTKNNYYKFGIVGFVAIFLIGTSIFFVLKSKAQNEEKERLLSRVDYRIFACGEEIFLEADKEALKTKRSGLFARSKSGSVIADGLVSSDDYVLLSSFFETVGGLIEYTPDHKSKLHIPTKTGMRKFESGDLCNGEEASLHAIHHRVETSTEPWSLYSRILWKEKDHHLMNNYGKVPPGDCLIFIFDTKDVLDRPWPTCAAHNKALATGELILEGH